MSNALPHWQLKELYPSLDSPELKADLLKIKSNVAALKESEFPPCPESVEELAADLTKMIRMEEELAEPVEAISVYCHSLITTDSYNSEAVKIESSLSGAMVALTCAAERLVRENPLSSPIAFLLSSQRLFQTTKRRENKHSPRKIVSTPFH